MVISVIIVNYQVKFFLELCLHSVEKALRGVDAEVFVVDNHSSDDSLEYLRPRFPGVRWLANTENLGFSRANNQALRQASGEYILFLNPDTILPEEFFAQCLAFLTATPRIGGLGVRMVDGSGNFLKESRRGFPGPWAGFCRLSGLSALFPRSRWFSGYYLGYLPADRPHPAPILSGACCMVRRAILGETGFFDEQFFLYAEDIDLSYRIEKAGYTNYYFPGTTIVHFKGESTRKDIRYIRQFYKAMRQFRRKHSGRGLPALLDPIQVAIGVRAGIAAMAGLFRRREEPSREGMLRTAVLGDARVADKLRAMINATHRRVLVAEPARAEEVILCEGEGLSFRESIVQLEALAKEGLRVKFHAGGSCSAVGSPDRNGRGEVLLLEVAGEGGS